MPDTSIQQDKELQAIFLPIALKSGAVRQDGSHTDDFDAWDTIIRDAIEAVQARDKELERRARLDEHSKWKAVAEEIVVKDGVYRAVNYLNKRSQELSS